MQTPRRTFLSRFPLVRFILIASVCALIITLISLSTRSNANAAPDNVIDITILALNDFHGALEPPTGSAGRVTTGLNPTTTVDAGGVEYLHTHLDNLRAENPRSVFVSAGDLIGATPLLSALFHDEPTIEAFSAMKLDFNAVGNHEFDEGWQELKRMQKGGCHPDDGCQDGDDFEGASFRFLSANVVKNKSGKTLFPAYGIRNFSSVKVAFIGMTLQDTPSIVSPSGVEGLTFKDEAKTVNKLIRKMKLHKMADIVVVLIHEGGLPTGLYNECPGISGAIVDIVNRTSGKVDLFITGHTHAAYNCIIDGRPVTSALSNGRLITEIDIAYDKVANKILSIGVDNNIVTRDVPKNPGQTARIAKYNAIAAPLAGRVIGSISQDITRTNNDAGESALGDVIADAQLAATAPSDLGDAVIAFMNPGGIRADLTFAQISGSENPGQVTYGESFTVQPFGNSLVTMSLTGQQIKDVLEQQFDNPAAGQNRILQVSEGFSYSWSESATLGSKISDMELNGTPIDLGATYRVTVNSFLADGGDNFAALKGGTDRLGGAVDTDALEEYFAGNSPVAPGPQDRITKLP